MSCDNCGAKRGHIPGCTKANTSRGASKFITVTCPTCRGSGKRGNRECGLCEGKGKIRVVDE